MNRLSAQLSEPQALGNLRARISQIRQDLVTTTAAYRDAAAVHDSQRAIPLLRSRSRLMRELLDTQCELLLTLRGQAQELPQAEEGSQTVSQVGY